MQSKTYDVTNTAQEMKEKKATNKVTRKEGKSPQSPPVKNKCYYHICL